MSNQKYHPHIPKLYKIWKGMVKRCYNKNSIGYPGYGGIGVVVCDEWRYNYQNFLNWALENGWADGLQIDKDIKAPQLPGKIYSPEYCSIVTPKQNSNNRVSSLFYQYNGERKTVSEICDLNGITKKHIVYGRLKKGYSMEDALDPKFLRSSPYRYDYNGQSLTVGEVASLENIPVGKLKSLLRYKNKKISDVVKKIKMAI